MLSNAVQDAPADPYIEDNNEESEIQRGATLPTDHGGDKSSSQQSIILLVTAEGQKQDDRGKAMQYSPELNLTNFPALTLIPVKNIFEVVPISMYDAKLPPRDRGGSTKLMC